MADNETTVIKQKIMSIVASLETIDAEKDMIKDTLASLKVDHEIKPKVARKAASIMHKGTREEDRKDREALDQLLEQLLK